MLSYLLYGLFIGFSIGFTIGPIAILCLRRSMVDGAWLGIATGFGASIAHFFFGSMAVFGLQFVQSFFAVYGAWIRLAGSIIILFIAARIARNPIVPDGTDYKSIGYGAAIITTLLINLSNPITIASYAAFISIAHLKIDSLMQAIFFLNGIFFGNLSWWILLSIGSTYISSLLSKKYIGYINIVSACLLTGLALLGIGTAALSILG